VDLPAIDIIDPLFQTSSLLAFFSSNGSQTFICNLLGLTSLFIYYLLLSETRNFGPLQRCSCGGWWIF